MGENEEKAGVQKRKPTMPADQHERALVRNMADEDQVKTAARKEKEQDVQWMSDLRVVLATQPGRRVAWRLLEEARLFKISVPGFFGDTNIVHETFFNEGQRNVGNWFLSEIERSDPDTFALMQREARGERHE